MNNLKFNIVKNIGVLKDGDYPSELNLVEWGNREPKYDLRTWKLKDGQKIPCKGVTLTTGELVALKRILNEMEVPESE